MKHGLKNSDTYKLLNGIKDRCLNPRSKDYHRYGGRGITISENFMNPIFFNEWCLNNGYKKGLQIDRIDNNKGYTDENCRFVTSKQNMRNTRVVRFYDGKSAGEWLETILPNYTRKQYDKFRSRLKYGWTIQEALTCMMRKEQSQKKKLGSFV